MLLGSPPCSPQIPYLMPFLAARLSLTIEPIDEDDGSEQRVAVRAALLDSGGAIALKGVPLRVEISQGGESLHAVVVTGEEGSHGRCWLNILIHSQWPAGPGERIEALHCLAFARAHPLWGGSASFDNG